MWERSGDFREGGRQALRKCSVLFFSFFQTKCSSSPSGFRGLEGLPAALWLQVVASGLLLASLFRKKVFNSIWPKGSPKKAL